MEPLEKCPYCTPKDSVRRFESKAKYPFIKKYQGFSKPGFGFSAGSYVIELEIPVNVVVVWFLLLPWVDRNLFHPQPQASSSFHVFLFCHIAMQ